MLTIEQRQNARKKRQLVRTDNDLSLKTLGSRAHTNHRVPWRAPPYRGSGLTPF